MKKEQKLIPMMKGFKATDKDMKCTPGNKAFQYEFDKIFEHEGELEMCKAGFHFCVHLSGVWSFYNNSDTRVFEVEAYDVLDERSGDGAEVKMVAHKIKFVREVKIGGDSNTGYSNTGYRNTGDSNTGYSNTGYRNTGDSNTGDSNTGYSNTGYRNTGDSNTGDRNTGYRNTGDSNTGDWNTGDRNTGNRNTGDWNIGDSNTGDWNTSNFSSGFFCIEEPKTISFNKPCELSRQDFLNRLDVSNLGEALAKNEPIDFEKVKTVPNITKEKLKKLHEKFIEARKAK
jgi:hypothetical protein